MNSGLLTFATKGKAFKTFGTHQKFDREAHRLASAYIGTGFPTRKQILNFEGMGGPDGLKFKGKYTADHLWDPINEIGFLPIWIDVHYKNLVTALKLGDTQKAAFEAGYMAHYLTDSLTPAHHLSFKLIMAGYEDSGRWRKKWLAWGGRKGPMRSHVAFETGVSSAVSFGSIHANFDPQLFKNIQKNGLPAVVKQESRSIAELDLYQKFLRSGWTVSLAKAVKAVVVKRIPQLIAAAWVAAYAEAGHELKTKP
ncbi:hypothetical protein HYX70_02980 [Candidatus Saccharibacteria bacterium]|nr:hypothetical protein [Candidatus Saccharibacteria bacterium]